MKKMYTIVLCMVLAAGSLAAQDQPLTEKKDKISYSVGRNIGMNVKEMGVEVNVDLMMRGIKDAVSGATPLITDQEVAETLQALQAELVAMHEQKQKAAAEKNAKDEAAFLTENAKKEGVIALPSGLQYKVITEGTGAKPKSTDTVTTHYKGTLLDGTVFDSSYDRGEPASFGVSGVIAGWTEALQMMPVGSKWQLFIPSKLAYGERGAGDVIAPGSTLIFEIELISIKQAE